MKRVYILLMAMVVAFALAGCSGTDAEPEEATPTDAGVLGSYEVAIGDCEIVKDYDGNDTIAISIDFTNNGEEATSFEGSMMYDVFQDGVELETTSVYVDDDSLDCLDDDAYKDIKPGKTIEVVVTKKLENTTSPVDIEIEELFGSDDKVVKTFELEE